MSPCSCVCIRAGRLLHGGKGTNHPGTCLRIIYSLPPPHNSPGSKFQCRPSGENPPRTILCQLFSHLNPPSSNLNNAVQTPALVPMVLFGGGVGRAEEGEFGEYFFNQINYCWETSHFSPFNLYSMGNPSNTPARSARQDQRDAASDQGGRQKMGWSAGNEQTTGGKASGKACGEEGKPRDVSAAPQTREEGRKLEQAGAWAEWDGVEWDGMRWDRMGWLGTARSFSPAGRWHSSRQDGGSDRAVPEFAK